MKDGEHYTATATDGKGNQDYLIYDFKTGNVTDTLVRGSTLMVNNSVIHPEGFTLNENETKILFTTESEKIYRRSSIANYLVYDRKTKQLLPVSKNGKQQVATISPDGNSISFVRDNNLYVESFGGQESQITNDGKKNFIINGVCDWVYEEEFAFSRAYQWSPDGKSIAYYRFDV